MKATTLSFIAGISLLLCISCGSQKKEQSEEQTPAAQEAKQPAAEQDATELLSDSIAGDAQQDTDEKLSLGGMITVDPHNYANVTTLMAGTIGKIAVRPGHAVKKGSVIATLRQPEFVELQQQYLDAVAQTEFLEAEYKRQKTLLSNEAASEKKYQQSKADYLSMKSRKDAAAARLNQLGVNPNRIVSEGIMESLAITSPIDGYVGDIGLKIGQYLQVGDHICNVVNAQSAMLELTAFSKNVGDIKVGSHLSFIVKVIPGETFHATVTDIAPIIDESSHSLKVYAKIAETHRKFLVGMYVRATVEDK